MEIKPDQVSLRQQDPSRFAPRVETLTTKSELLKANLQNGTSRAHQPTSFWTRKSDGPVSGHTGQREAGVSLVRRPGRASRIVRDHHSAAVVVSFLSAPSLSAPSIAAVANRPHVTQAENRTGYRRRIRKRPGFTAIARRGSSGVIRIA